MPSTINGIGTWYWGKSNIHTVNGVCQFCNSSVQLRSYDTTLFFVLVFVPVIPLGRKRIIDQCPRCTKHRVWPLQQWNKVKADAIATVTSEARSNRNDPKKAIEAVQIALTFREQQQYIAVANEMAAMHPKAWLLHATIGDGYRDFGMDAEAQAAYEKALMIEDQPQVRKALAVLMMQYGNTEAAHQLLHDAFDPAVPANVHFMFLLTEGYQSEGKHEQALDVLDEIQEKFPTSVGTKDYTRLRKISEKNLGTGKAVKSTKIKSLGAGTGVKSGGLASRIPRLIPLAILLLLAGIYFSVAIGRGASRTVWLVNGQSVQSHVTVNGKPYALSENGALKIDVPEGEIKMAVQREGQPDLNADASLHTNFWSRPFVSHTIVLNPDRCAVIIREEQVFEVSPSASNADNYGFEVHVGNSIYDLPGADFEFAPFPETMKLSSDSEKLHKWRVDNGSDYNPRQKLQLIYSHATSAEKLRYAQSRMLLNHEDLDAYALLMSADEPAKAREALQPLLDVRPAVVEAHRIYQELTERLEPTRDLEAQYTQELQKNPNDQGLMYLAGRMTRDREKAVDLFNRSVAGSHPVAYGYHALSWEALVRGDFEECLALSKKADAGNRERSAPKGYENDALCGLGRWDELLTQARAARTADPTSLAMMFSEISALSMLQRYDEADRTIDEAIAKLGAKGSADSLASLGARLHGLVKYYKGDEKGYADGLAKLGGEEDSFFVAYCRGEYTKAAKAIKGNDVAAASDHLSVSIAAKALAHDDALAQSELTAAIALFKSGSREEREAARILESATAPSAEDLRTLGIKPEDKRIILLAAGLKFPQIRQPAFDLAKKLDYRTAFPHWTLKKILDGAN